VKMLKPALATFVLTRRPKCHLCFSTFSSSCTTIDPGWIDGAPHLYSSVQSISMPVWSSKPPKMSVKPLLLWNQDKWSLAGVIGISCHRA
jgi:hypothetical protein